MRLDRTTFVAGSIDEVFAFFSDPKNLALITPPGMGFQILEAPGRELRRDDRIRYRIRVLGISLQWITHITEWSEGRFFTDVQEKGPYRKWVHTHEFRAEGSGVMMIDRVDYELPLGVVGRIFGGWLVRRQLEAIFDYRQKMIQQRFAHRSD